MDPITIAMGLAKFVPGIIKLMSGSDKAAEVADRVVSVAQAVTGTSSGEEALATIDADPNKVLEFRQAIGAMQVELEKAYLVDTQDARKRDTDLAKAGLINYRANVLAAGAVLLVTFCLLVVIWKTEMNEFAKGTITLICGRALGWVEQVFSFEFGTTRANKVKDDTIKNLSK